MPLTDKILMPAYRLGWLVPLQKEKIMKNASVWMLLGIILCSLVFWLAGCGLLKTEQLGETAAEGNRRHQRNLRINQQELMGDIDRGFLFDEPSKATPRRIP